jgi:uncharacterized protein YfaP (DUF2135 family)
MSSASRLALAVSVSLTLTVAACGGASSFSGGSNAPAATNANGDGNASGSGDAAKASPTPSPSATTIGGAPQASATPAPSGSPAASASEAPKASAAPTAQATATPTPPPAGQASLSGSVHNAVDNAPLAGALIALANGMTTTSDALGNYAFSSLPGGAMHVTVSLAGFTGDAYDVTLTGGNATTLNMVLSPALMAGELRFVLAWAPRSFDLDGHLKGPSSGGRRFHVYYDAEDADNAHQDIDDYYGNAPETITVTSLVDGHYVYYVRDYTHSSGRFGYGDIPGPGPVVKVYQGSQVIGTFTPSAAFPAGATTWHVVDVDVVGGVPHLTPLGDATCDTTSCD